MKKNYLTPKLTVELLEMPDIVTSSMGEKTAPEQVTTYSETTIDSEWSTGSQGASE